MELQFKKICPVIFWGLLVSGSLGSETLQGRAWMVADESCARAPQQYARRAAVPFLGYPYGGDWTGYMAYLAPFAGPYRPQQGWAYTFGYAAVDGYDC